MVHEVSPEEVYDMLLSEDDVVIVDVLPSEYFRKQHLPKAINIPLENVDTIAPAVLEKKRKIIVYCYDRSCNASLKAAEKLLELGYEDVHDLDVGVEGYKAAGFSVSRL